MTSSLPQLSRALLALALGLGGLLLSAVPAGALGAWGIESPAPGTRLAGPQPVTVVAFVDHASAEEIQRVEVRFTWRGQPVGVVRRLDLLDAREVQPGLIRSRYSGQLDPMSASWFEFRAVPNGYYQLHARVQYAVQGVNQEASPWSTGSELVFDVPPPATTADASLVDPAARSVAVSWKPVGTDMADFTRYIIERAGTDGVWRVVEVTSDPSASRFTDTAPADGEYRYRVTVHRAGADDERASQPADTRAVHVRPDAEPEPEPDPDGAGAEPPDGGEGPGGEPPAEGEGGEAAPPRSSSWRPWVFPTRPPRPGPRQPPAQPRAAPPPADSTFEEYLDYGEQEWEVTERQVVREAPPGGGSTLTVFNQELQPEQVLVPVAGGLVLIMLGAHVVRFLNP
jgi:hypothetical protein